MSDEIELIRKANARISELDKLYGELNALLVMKEYIEAQNGATMKRIEEVTAQWEVDKLIS